MDQGSTSLFKTCPGCFEQWKSHTDFVKDPALLLNGYKADFEKLEYGLFFFTHMKKGCRSTMAIEVDGFIDLYQGEIHGVQQTRGDDCPGYCLDEEQLDRCEAICECAFVREIMQILKEKTAP